MEDFLDKVYANTADDRRYRYAKWSTTHAKEVGKNGYITPARTTGALARHVSNLGTPVLDYGCGTRLSGVVHRAVVFRSLYSIDVSKETVAIANTKKFYQTLRVFDTKDVPSVNMGEFGIITAIGVIGIGAAPLCVFDATIALLASGSLFAFSFNDHTLSDQAYEAKVSHYVDTSKAKLPMREYGDHLPGAGLKSYVNIFQLS